MKTVEIRVTGSNPGEAISFWLETKRHGEMWTRDTVIDSVVGEKDDPTVQQIDLRDDQRITIMNVERRVRYDKEQNAAVPMTAEEVEADDAAKAPKSELTDDEARRQNLEQREQEAAKLKAQNEPATSPEGKKLAPPQPASAELPAKQTLIPSTVISGPGVAAGPQGQPKPTSGVK